MRLSTSPGEEEGLPLTIAATHLDGLVLALTPNHHSYNYRSAILHGFGMPVTDVEEKLWAMERITNNVVDERWENTRVPPTKTEMTSKNILFSELFCSHPFWNLFHPTSLMFGCC
jgi:nitroimidazol reductase NimA-like FMN-containing flavoprotein (pyridoxamine 5'-phosphate oxidase superfamily)